MNQPTNNDQDSSIFSDFIDTMEGLDDDNEADTVINHNTVHPYVIEAWGVLSKKTEFDLTALENQILTCTGTEILNGVIGKLRIVAEADLAHGRPAEYFISANELADVIADTQMITHQIMQAVILRWNDTHGQP